MTTVLMNATRRPGRYGITEKKKAELDALTLQVLDAQHEVEQFQAIVNSLTEKSQNFSNFLNIAEVNKTQAQNNRDIVDNLVQNATDLRANSNIAFNEMALADDKTKDVALQVTVIVNELIYSAEVINKLATLIVRNKALNPLISDELVALIGTAGKDANNAVALSLTALKSTFAARASNMGSEAATVLEQSQSWTFYQVLTGTDAEGNINPQQKDSLKSLLDEAYLSAQANFTEADLANKRTLSQLNKAASNLNAAQIKLQSLQLGLSAATAAALAS